MPSLFKVDHLNVSFGSTQVLKGLSFEIGAGEFIGIIGPNGSGKSTLLRTLAGVLSPAAGSVTLDGRALSTMHGRDLARRLAVVPQDSSVAFDYTVTEIVLMGRAPHQGRFGIESERDIDLAQDALKRTNLLPLADRRAGELSGGERQRVMIARALAQDTDILFLDEPTAHLDINYQVEILHLARRANSENGKTVVVVLHDLNLAAEFCDRLIMLRGGELFAQGKPDDVITSENVRKVYGASVWVKKHPTSGRPYVISTGSHAVASRLSRHPDSGKAKTVHVLCGGGSGSAAFVALLEAGCEVTAGVINIGDTDQEAAESLGLEYVEDAPFSPISEKAIAANLEFVESADAVVIADAPFGTGNMSLLDSAVHAVGRGKPVAIIGSKDHFSARDFAGGEVTRSLCSLVESGASVLDSTADLEDWISGR